MCKRDVFTALSVWVSAWGAVILCGRVSAACMCVCWSEVMFLRSGV